MPAQRRKNRRQVEGGRDCSDGAIAEALGVRLNLASPPKDVAAVLAATKEFLGVQHSQSRDRALTAIKGELFRPLRIDRARKIRSLSGASDP